MGTRLILLILSISLIPCASFATFNLQKLVANEKSIQKDLELILAKANLDKNLFSFSKTLTEIELKSNTVTIECNKGSDQINFAIVAEDEEWSATLYLGLQKLGFLFPHPRIQISPKINEMKAHCGKSYKWRPALKYRGSHLHTQHASEWVDGFLMGRTKIAEDLIHWLVRNNQNIFDLYLLRMEDEKIFNYLTPLFNKARALGIHTGVTLGIAFHQQNAYKLVSLWGSLFDGKSRDQINTNLPKLLKNLPLSFINVEMGTSEFTPVNYDRMLSWLNQIGKISSAKNIQMVTKIHASTNQKNEKYGNFNFLPQFADKSVGILPHTVFYHALEDPKAPLYGNKNFKYMKEFMLQETSKRMTWYYPETSYYIALDIDIPLLIVEYLRTRALDMKLIHKHNVHGILNFTTGHENGYWLMDWSLTLFNNLDYNFAPTIGLKLLKQDIDFWSKYMAFQKKHFTEQGLISIITFSNGGDELAPKHKILKRNLLRELKSSEKKLKEEIKKLEMALQEIPKLPEGGINSELRAHVNITNLRISHALNVRYALSTKENIQMKTKYLNKAKSVRAQAQKLMNTVMRDFNRYPESFVYQRFKNPTAYPYGYGYTSSNLHYWEREEMMVKENNYSPFFMNIWDFIDILF